VVLNALFVFSFSNIINLDIFDCVECPLKNNAFLTEVYLKVITSHNK